MSNDYGVRKIDGFDLAIVKDAIQHVPLKDGMKMIANVVNSGVKYFITSSYPCTDTTVISIIFKFSECMYLRTSRKKLILEVTIPMVSIASPSIFQNQS